MCGIFGCILSKGQVAPIIHSALQRLDYRGYDSVGEATIYQKKIYLKKDFGKIEEVHKKLNLDNLVGSIGIGHTRWATHGAPNKENSHPHIDCFMKIAVVHNGIIENFNELRDDLVSSNHVFVSKTDTEVIPHLIEEKIKQGFSYEESFKSSLKELEGSYALVALSIHDPTKLFCARKESPLIIGIGEDSFYISSDIPALLPLTKKIVSLDNNEVAIISDHIEVRKLEDWSLIEKKINLIEWTYEMAQKKGYAHFMLKEIHEQPSTLKNALRLQEKYLELLATFLDRSKEIYLLACGTSHNACIASSYMFSKLGNLSTIPIIASEFPELYIDAINIDSTIFAVSQSGETADVLHSIEMARFKAATILGLTNVIGSTLTRISRAYVCQQSGPEIGVAATKTFTSQLIVMSQIALRLAKKRGKVSQDEIDNLEEKLQIIPNVVDDVIKNQEIKIRKIVKKYINSDFFFFLGRGINTATALEGRLKLLEVAYIPSLAYPAGESKHGPISLVQQNVPVLFICTPGNTRKAMFGNVMEMKARGANIISILDEKDKEMKENSDDFIEIPTGLPEILSPIVYCIPLQLFAYYTAIGKGFDPDKPRNIAKSVTVL